jgi:hypothetical protein
MCLLPERILPPTVSTPLLKSKTKVQLKTLKTLTPRPGPLSPNLLQVSPHPNVVSGKFNIHFPFEVSLK